MRYLSVCSGIEAATVAWHAMGWEAAAFSEVEPFPRAAGFPRRLHPDSLQWQACRRWSALQGARQQHGGAGDEVDRRADRHHGGNS